MRHLKKKSILELYEQARIIWRGGYPTVLVFWFFSARATWCCQYQRFHMITFIVFSPLPFSSILTISLVDVFYDMLLFDVLDTLRTRPRCRQGFGSYVPVYRGSPCTAPQSPLAHHRYPTALPLLVAHPCSSIHHIPHARIAIQDSLLVSLRMFDFLLFFLFLRFTFFSISQTAHLLPIIS